MRTRGSAKTLELKVGACVMITQNIDVSNKLINGQVGFVFHIHIGNNGRPDIVYLKFDKDDVGLKAKRTNEYAMKNNCVPIKEEESLITLGKNINFMRKNFPLLLAFAVTIHKVQGIQFPNGVISFKLFKQRAFNPGQLYVALSRIESLEGLYVTGNVRKELIRADKYATREYERLRMEASIVPIKRFELLESNFIISLLNVRSLRTHIADIQSDHILRNSDLLLFTETQIEEGYDTTSIFLQDFKFDFCNEEDKFRSLAVCYRNEIAFKIVVAYVGFMVFSVCKQKYSSLPIKGLLIYKKNNMSDNEFAYLLNHVFSRNTDIDIILGDINLDGFAMPNVISNVLNEFDLIVKEPTQLSGKMLDQIYVKKNIDCKVKTLIKNIYFSDHDAVTCQLTICE